MERVRLSKPAANICRPGATIYTICMTIKIIHQISKLLSKTVLFFFYKNSES